MTIANISRAIPLADDSDFIGTVYSHNISNDGYWYTYHPSDYDSNNVLAGNSIISFEWDSVLNIAPSSRLSGGTHSQYSAQMAEIDGTIAFIDDTNNANNTNKLRYHGGVIQHIGSGQNDITNVQENDAFMFSHLGTFGDNPNSASFGDSTHVGTLEDDAFYWDRLYQTTAGANWEYYPYHQHLPSNYLKFDDGRIVFDADGFIRPNDKQYGYLINIQVNVQDSANAPIRSYSSPLARIHTPSVGGAHNSHNDVSLPTVGGVNYVPGGILKGSSNRFHAWYLDSAPGNQWNVYSRSYTSSSGAFSAQVSYGSYDLATPDFNPYPNQNQYNEGISSGYALRASTGHTFGAKVYVPTIMKAIPRSYSLTMNNVGNVYQVDGTDRYGPNGFNDLLDGVQNQPTIYAKVGDTLTFDTSSVYVVHPMNIQTTSGKNDNTIAPGSSGNGGATVTFTPQSAGTFYYVCTQHTGMYGEISVSALEGTFDQQIWAVTDADTISPGTLTRIDLPYEFQGITKRPDCFITSVGTRMYIAASGGTYDGGVTLYSTTSLDSTGSLTDEGQIVSNGTDTSDMLRLHGFKYNSNTTKFFALISGNDALAGNYSGKGLYSFDLAGGAFDGYDHLAYNTTTGGFETKAPLTSNHISYDHATGVLTHKTTSEPEGIPSGSSVLQWEVASPNFFNQTEINSGAEEEYFQGIYLKDGRKALVGRVEKHDTNLGEENTGDLILTIVDNENKAESYTFGGDGDDFITGIIEDTDLDRLVISGYCKGELANKGDQWVHGWGRNIHQTNDSAGMRFNDVVKDSGGFTVIGTDDLNKEPVIFKYDNNYVNTRQKYFSIGVDSTETTSLTKLSDGSLIASGWSMNGTSRVNGYIAKISADHKTVDWAKRVRANETDYFKIRTHTVVKNSGTETIVGFLQSSTSDNLDDRNRLGILFTMNTDGNILNAVNTEGISSSANTNSTGFSAKDFYFQKIKPGRPNTGEFIAVGSHHSQVGTNQRSKEALAIGNVNDDKLFRVFSAFPENNINKYGNDSWAVSTDHMFYDAALIDHDSSTNIANFAVVGKGGSDTLPLVAKIKYTDAGVSMGTSLEYVFDANIKSTYGTMDKATSVLVEDSDRRDWWKNETAFYHNGISSLIIGGEGNNLDGAAVHPDYSTDILMNTDTWFVGMNDSQQNNDFNPVNWGNSMGHMGHDKMAQSMVWDSNGTNFVTVGSSTSHSVGEDGLLFRLWKDGFGNGVYHTDASTSNAYYYDSAHLHVDAAINGPSDYSDYYQVANITVNLNDDRVDSSAITSTNLETINLSTNLLDSSYVTTDYNGSYGANGLFNGFLGWVNKKDIQNFNNSQTFKDNKAKGLSIHRADDIFNIRQFSTVGDATADDGNIFAYDVIKSADGEYYYLACQTSGNVAKQNTGLSGVYDYMIAQYDIPSDQFRFWQNGDAMDEEVYALTELKPTSYHVTNPEAIDNGLGVGTVSWTPSADGTYYYQCGNHAAMNGQIVVQNNTGGSTFNITVVYTNAPVAFRFLGTDRNGIINSSTDNPTLTFYESDTINFIVSRSGHPFHIQTQAGLTGTKNGQIAFTGRSTGSLGGHTNIGGYDIFLGIFDPLNWTADYYQNGSGFNDKGMNLHDISMIKNDTLAIAYTSFGSVAGGNTFGSEDIGIITFNYNTDSWSKGFSTGTETSEEIEQNGKPSALLDDGRIAVICNTAGAFADDQNTFGLKDFGLGIFDFDSDGAGNYAGWSKYQTGSGSSDFSYSVSTNGSILLCVGYSEATWDRDIGGVFIEFDPQRNILAKSAG